MKINAWRRDDLCVPMVAPSLQKKGEKASEAWEPLSCEQESKRPAWRPQRPQQGLVKQESSQLEVRGSRSINHLAFFVHAIRQQRNERLGTWEVA